MLRRVSLKPRECPDEKPASRFQMLLRRRDLPVTYRFMGEISGFSGTDCRNPAQ